MALVRWVVGGALVACVALSAGHARACGGGGVTTYVSQAGVVADSQRVVISVTSRGTTETVVQIGVPQTTADYGVLIPTPSEPTLDPTPISENQLNQLDTQSRPTIVKEYPDSSSDDSGCGCSGDDDSSGSAAPGTGDAVSASAPVNVGPVTAVVLTATDASALSYWLDTNGFTIPDERQDLVASYVGPGRYFIAVKRNDATADGGPSSIGLHYSLAGDHRLLSLAFARLGAAPTVAFTVFLFAPEKAFPSAPFQALTLDDLDANLLLKNDYQGAVQQAVKAHDSHAFVLEAGSLNWMASAALPTTVVDRGAAFVRMSTVVAADDLTEDATFFAPESVSIVHTRTIKVGTVVHASVGMLGFVALAWGARRRHSRLRLRADHRRSTTD